MEELQVSLPPYFLLPAAVLKYFFKVRRDSLSSQERTAVLAALAEKSHLTEEMFYTVPGITCNPVQGAMYTFPRITLPQKAIAKAQVRMILLVGFCQKKGAHF